MRVHRLGQELVFPDPRHLEHEPEKGLVAIGGDFSVPRLLQAYRSGIFPWTDRPITWWSPDPRGVIEFERFHVPGSLKRLLKKCLVLPSDQPVGQTSSGLWEITINRAFNEVAQNCATARKSGNWITRNFVSAYTDLHVAGHAHSLEVWEAGKLVGGIYGVSSGAFFAGESMFHYVSNASKVALYFLHDHLVRRGFELFDVQVLTPTTIQFGGTTISRLKYLSRLETALLKPVSFLP